MKKSLIILFVALVIILTCAGCMPADPGSTTKVGGESLPHLKPEMAVVGLDGITIQYIYQFKASDGRSCVLVTDALYTTMSDTNSASVISCK